MRRHTVADVVALPLLALLTAFVCAGSVARDSDGYRATGTFAATQWPYVPGSRLPASINGFPVPYHLALVGPGALSPSGTYVIPERALPSSAFLVAGNAGGLAAQSLRIGEAPRGDRSTIAVASYDDGIVFHDTGDFSVTGLLATGGAPSDDAIDSTGRIATADTQGSTVTIASLLPAWRVSQVGGVPVGDELAIDEATRAIFVTNRDYSGGGALSRISADGSVDHVVTGQTPEGLAIDERRQIVYVANVNDNTVAVVDARTMRVMRRFHAIARIFSLALSPDGNTLYGISNQSEDSPFAAAGSALAISVNGPRVRVLARSRPLTFPLGEALDSAAATLYVTDESDDVVYVLDARTMRPKRAPLRTCHTPWKPTLDVAAGRLYVPCARSDSVDVFDTHTLHHVAGAPFATGSYPLALVVWHAKPGANRFTHR